MPLRCSSFSTFNGPPQCPCSPPEFSVQAPLNVSASISSPKGSFASTILSLEGPLATSVLLSSGSLAPYVSTSRFSPLLSSNSTSTGHCIPPTMIPEGSFSGRIFIASTRTFSWPAIFTSEEFLVGFSRRAAVPSTSPLFDLSEISGSSRFGATATKALMESAGLSILETSLSRPTLARVSFFASGVECPLTTPPTGKIPAVGESPGVQVSFSGY